MPSAKRNPRGRSARRHRRGGGNPVAIAKVKADADRCALDVLPIIIEIHPNGKTSLGEIRSRIEQAGDSYTAASPMAADDREQSARARQTHVVTRVRSAIKGRQAALKMAVSSPSSSQK